MFPRIQSPKKVHRFDHRQNLPKQPSQFARLKIENTNEPESNRFRIGRNRRHRVRLRGDEANVAFSFIGFSRFLHPGHLAGVGRLVHSVVFRAGGWSVDDLFVETGKLISVPS
jgi:hypothetical protein